MTLLEIVIVLGLVALTAAGSSQIMAMSKRYQDERIVMGRLHVIDAAQLEFLRRYPGRSLQDATAAPEIAALMQAMEMNSSSPRKDLVLASLQVDLTARPVTGVFQGRQLSTER